MPGAVKKEPPYGSLTTGPSLRPATRNGGQKKTSYAQSPDSPTHSIDSTDAKKPNIPGFLTKTFEIFSSDEYTDLCGWGENGDTIVIKKVAEFSSTVLPKYFKHSNFQSFVRQLNMYDFHKTVQDPSHGEFKHEYFKKGRADLLRFIKRKVSQPLNSSKTTEPVLTTTAITPVNGTALVSTDIKAGAAPTSVSTTEPVVTLPALNGAPIVGGADPPLGNKAWQRRVEQRMNTLEDTNRVLMQENQILFHTLNQQTAQLRSLKDCLGKLVTIMNDYTEGNVPAIQRLRGDLEQQLMPAPAPLLAGPLPTYPGVPALPSVGDVPAEAAPVTTPAVTTGGDLGLVTGANAGGELSRTLSVEPLWRGHSLNSLPSLGPDFELPPDFLFSRMSSLGFDRLHSFDRTASADRPKKKGKFANAEAQALQDQLEVLRRSQQDSFQRIDSLEHQLTTLFDGDELVDLGDHEGGGEGPMEISDNASNTTPNHVVQDSSSLTLPLEPQMGAIPVIPHIKTEAVDMGLAPNTAFTTTTTTLPLQPIASFPPGPMEGGALVKQAAVYAPVSSNPPSRRSL